MTCLRPIAAALLLCLSLTAWADDDVESKPLTMPTARLYLGGAGLSNGGVNGNGAILGYQGFTKLGKMTSSYFGLEILGAEAGTGFLPIFTADLGLRFAPFPEAPVRPYLRGSLGVSLLIILPIPSLSAGIGIGIPIANAVMLDLSVGYRHAFNLFDSGKPVQVATLDLGVGF